MLEQLPLLAGAAALLGVFVSNAVRCTGTPAARGMSTGQVVRRDPCPLPTVTQAAPHNGVMTDAEGMERSQAAKALAL